MEPNDLADSDTESICSTTSASSFSSERRAKVFAKFSPSVTTDQLYDHFADNGFDRTQVDIRRRTNRATGKPSGTAMVLTTSPEEEIIALLNGTVIVGKYTLKIEAFRQQSKKPIKKSTSTLSVLSGTSAEMEKPNCKKIASSTESDSCRIFVGAGLPKYVNEQHIQEHFHEFSHAITKVDCIRDKQTNTSKGYFFVTFKTEASANMAIQRLNQSLLLGKHKLKVEHQKSHANVISSPSMPILHEITVIVDNLDPRISSDEIKALIGVPVVKFGSLEPNTHQRCLQFHNQHDASIAIQNLHGKNLLGKTVHAYSQNECVQRPSNDHCGNQGSFHQPFLPLSIRHSDSQPHLHGHNLDSRPQPVPLAHPVSLIPSLQPSVTGLVGDDSPRSCAQLLQPTLSQAPILSLLDSYPPNNLQIAESPNSVQSLCYPVKITRLPMSTSEEALNALFSQAGEILERPIVHSSEQPYAHVNFKHESGAQNAVQRFNGTVFCGRVIRVSAQRSKPLSRSTMIMRTASLDCSSGEEVPAKLIEPKRYLVCILRCIYIIVFLYSGRELSRC